MRILLLGGIGEAARLARWLSLDHRVIYSVAGKGRAPDVPCVARSGGFGGVGGLAAFVRQWKIDLLIDATHPYAAHISRNASAAAREAAIPWWAYRRPPWRPELGDRWITVASWADLTAALRPFSRPFFTIGLEPLAHAAEIPPHQHWLARCLAGEAPAAPNLTVLRAIGPFSLEQELALLCDRQIDIVVSKNSGGAAVEAKLTAARQRGLPVALLDRPVLPVADREFDTVEALAAELITPVESYTGE